MIASATRFEMAIPMRVSSRMRASALAPCAGCRSKGSQERPRGNDGHQQAARFGHRTEVRTNVANVGEYECCHEAVEEGCGVVTPHVACDPKTGRPSKARADGLDRYHQRIGEEQGP